ncbi:MAG: primosomal protein N' [Chitinophagales bacterium]
MSSLVTYVDVILPLPLPQAYTYAVPVDLVAFVKVGQRVIVQFGKNKFYSAIIKKVHHNKPAVEAKLIEGLAEEEAVVTETQLAFWAWVSSYYMCTEGEVMNAALPAGLKISSETKIRFNEHYEGDYEALSDDEFTVVQALRAQDEMRLPDIQDLLKKRNVYPLLKTLFNLGIAVSSEELLNKFKPRTEVFVKLADEYRNEDKLEKLYEDLSRAPKQVQLLLAYTQLGAKAKHIRKNELLDLAKVSSSVLKGLVDKGVFAEFRVEVSRLGNFKAEEPETLPLSEEQQKALGQIRDYYQSKQVVLLHGVTGSGKTNIYIEKIKGRIEKGEQVLYLLPEIALTAQIINRLRKVFGDTVGIYHSKFNQNERVEIWNKVLRGEYKVIIGARSALFLPFKQLGLVIVDEEHDQSLKQFDPAPRYNARDSSIVLASMFNAHVILGTATPSIETYYNCEKEKFGLVKLTRRYGGMEMPEISIVDTRTMRRKHKMQGNFSNTMIDEISLSLQNKEQVILFINRRGFANYQVCKTCNYVYKCKNCDVSLTYHKFQNQLICHYCGYFEKVSNKCKSCGAIDLDIVGMGTEKIEDEIAEHFPSAKVGRLDYDAVRTKQGHAEVISKFENREIDILVGTQMVTKGLDFDHVSLVGIINADQLLNHPGYRAHERAFQLMMQVAGRAGRKNKKGKVLIQCSDPLHPIIQDVVSNDYKRLYERELLYRRQFQYPPFTRLIEITLRHKEVQAVEKAALYFVNETRKQHNSLVLGPAVPFISKVNNYYIREVLLKTTAQTPGLPSLKESIRQVLDKMKGVPEFKNVDISVDVDPL